MIQRNFSRSGLSIGVNIFICCTLLPLLIPPFNGFSLSDLKEVFFWQGSGFIGWPLALLGIVLSIPFGSGISGALPVISLLLYPAIQFLLIHQIFSKTSKHLLFILLHILITLSFIVVWYYVLNGYDFMVG
jgi:hypothetical protein